MNRRSFVASTLTIAIANKFAIADAKDTKLTGWRNAIAWRTLDAQLSCWKYDHNWGEVRKWQGRLFAERRGRVYLQLNAIQPRISGQRTACGDRWVDSESETVVWSRDQVAVIDPVKKVYRSLPLVWLKHQRSELTAALSCNSLGRTWRMLRNVAGELADPTDRLPLVLAEDWESLERRFDLRIVASEREVLVSASPKRTDDLLANAELTCIIDPQLKLPSAQRIVTEQLETVFALRDIKLDEATSTGDAIFTPDLSGYRNVNGKSLNE